MRIHNRHSLVAGLLAIMIAVFAFANHAVSRAAGEVNGLLSITCAGVRGTVFNGKPFTGYIISVETYTSGKADTQVFTDENGYGDAFIEFFTYNRTLPLGEVVYASMTGPDLFIEGNFRCDSRMDLPPPEAYTLREITCDVRVYAEPNADFPTDATLRQGQTWYVAPVTSSVSASGTATKYTQWVSVFIGGRSLGFIPTECVKFN
ncbi:MAG: hypothetical protein OHK0023_25570 [Anaerolineae bacterium]